LPHKGRTNVAAFFFFIVIATVVSNVAARVRTQAVVAMGRARATESLYAFSRKLAGVGALDDVLWATAYQTALMLAEAQSYGALARLDLYESPSRFL
jgi:two-component system sensor histidine kinase KdpD